MAEEDMGAAEREGNGTEEGNGVLTGTGWEMRGSGCRAGRDWGRVCPVGRGRDLTEPGHSHCSWGHLWHLLWPQAVPMLPQQSSCLVRPGRGLLPH